MTRVGPDMTELRRLTPDRSEKIASIGSLEELSGVQWAIANRFAAPLSAEELGAFERRRAKLVRQQGRQR